MRRNSFDLIRLLAATLVVFSHSFVLTSIDPLEEISGGLSFGRLGLAIFFILSGYLVWQNWERDPSFYRYLARRVVRILPALFLAGILGAFVFGAILTTLPLERYFLERETLLYPLKTVSLMTLNQDLPGVLAEEPYPLNQINVPLWTLPIEAAAYIMLLPLGLLFSHVLFLKKQKKRILRLLFLSCLTILFSYSLFVDSFLFPTISGQILWLWILFFLGLSLNTFERVDVKVFILSLLLVPLFLTPMMPLAVGVICSLFILSLGKKSFSLGQRFVSRFGDMSYGIYIFAFLFQQTLVYFFPGMGPFLLFLLAMILVLPVARLSWVLVEKPALRRKPRGKSETGELSLALPNDRKVLGAPKRGEGP